jgi:ADP-ribosyl-[dinitrogen reductase] hydrolase
MTDHFFRWWGHQYTLQRYRLYRQHWNEDAFDDIIAILATYDHPMATALTTALKDAHTLKLDPSSLFDRTSLFELSQHRVLKFWSKKAYPDLDEHLNKFLTNLEQKCQFKYALQHGDPMLLKAIGALVGLACGDALGTTLEFTSRGSNPWHTEMIGHGVFELNAGEWTDDTSMAMCLAESLIKDGFDLRSQMELYVKWMRFGYLSSNGKCFDIGITTCLSIRRFITMDDPKAGSTEPNQAGNGSIMRLAPVVLHENNLITAINKAGESSLTTHGSPECEQSCRYLACVLHLCIHHQFDSKAALFEKVKQQLPHLKLTEPKILNLVDTDSWKDMTYDDLPNSGYVVETLISALWCFYHSDNAEHAIVQAVNLAGDADTIGAVCGQIAGAFYGYYALPQRWRDTLVEEPFIVKQAYKLHNKNHKKAKRSAI